jgi:hypothetical protein
MLNERSCVKREEQGAVEIVEEECARGPRGEITEKGLARKWK